MNKPLCIPLVLYSTGARSTPRLAFQVARFAAVPVIVITAFQSAGDVGAAEVVHKPIDIQRLLALVRQLLLAAHSYN